MDRDIVWFVHEIVWIVLAAWQVANLTVIAVQLRRHREECAHQNTERVFELTKLRHALVETGTRVQDALEPAVDAHVDAVTRAGALSAHESNRAGSVVPIRGQRPPGPFKPDTYGQRDSEPPSKPVA